MNTRFRELRSTTILAALLILSAAAFRLVHLGADPNYDDWIGYVTDEGRWVQAARGVALHGGLPRPGLGELHLLLAPLFQCISLLSFWISDVTLASARLFPALSSCATLAVFWVMMRRVAGDLATTMGLAVLAFQSDYLALSRMAVPEAPVMLLSLLLYWVLTSRLSTSGSFAAGLVTAIALGMKATSAPLLLVGSAIATFTVQPGSRSRRLLTYWSGVLTPAVVAGLGALVLVGAGVLSTPSYPVLRVATDMLGVSSVYSIISFPFSDRFGMTVNFLAFGVWVSLVATAGRPPAARDPVLSRHLMSSLLWVGLFTPIMLGLSYFPTRYRVLVMVPLAIHLTCALALATRVHPSTILDAFMTGWRGSRGVLNRALLVLPPGVFLAPLAAQVLTTGGLEPDRLTTRIAAVAAVAVCLAVVLEVGRRRRGLVAWLLVLSPAFLVASGLQASLGLSFWPAPGDLSHFALGLGVSAAAGVLVKTGTGRSLGLPLSRTLLAGAVSAVTVAGVADAASRYVSPNYTMQRAATQVVPLLSECGVVRVLRAGSIFNGNAIRYESHREGEVAQCLVTAFLTADETAQIRSNYSTVGTLPLFVSRQYCDERALQRRMSDVDLTDDCPVEIEVHRLRPPGG